MNESIQKAISRFKTQKLLAEAIGVRQAVVSHYLNERRNPSRRVAVKLEKAMSGEIPWYDFMSKVEVAQEVTTKGNNNTANDAA